VTKTSVALVRLLCVVVGLGFCVLPGAALADRWESDYAPQIWRATKAEAYLREAPNVNAAPVLLVRAGTALRVLSDEDGWKRVFDPRSMTTAYVSSDLLTRTEQPSAFAYKSAPQLDQQLSTVAIATTELPLYWYPDPDVRARALTLDASSRESVVGTVIGTDGAAWYETMDGYFLPPDGLFMADAPQEYGGRWLDVSLTGAAKVVAYENGEPVRSFFAIKGVAKFPTPLGAWSIVRRVQDETMDSTTVGIPRNAPGGYYLQHVLYTQYFRDTGESLHYNWWSSAWGAPGSHGCLGLSLGDSKWLWDWANVGTPVLIHS
jgi:lipoprotein-anchoring transpeptidase ErfK/SrfK